jgi:outer membrane protein OmpA-like peptidoglycan-associated protein
MRRSSPIAQLAMPLTLGALVSACPRGQLALTAEEATTLIEDHLSPEEERIQNVCELVTATKPAALVPVNTLPKEMLVAEAKTNLDTLFDALGASQSCRGGELVAAALGHAAPSLEPCTAALTISFRDALAASPSAAGDAGRRARLVRALRAANLDTAEKLLDDPLEAARRIDFSPALVVAMVRLADTVETVADDAAENVPYVSGLAKAVLRLLAAEIVAATTDAVLDGLEQSRLIHPAAVARTACGMIRGSSSSRAVASALLRRAILRFEPSEWTDPKASYPPEGTCTAVRSHARKTVSEEADPCAEIARYLSVDEQPSALDVAPPRLAASRRDGSGILAQPAAYVSVFEKPTELSRTLLESTDHCGFQNGNTDESRVECTLEFLNTVSSLLRYHADLRARGDETTAERKRRYDEIAGHFGALRRELASLRGDLDDIRAHIVEVEGTVNDGARADAAWRAEIDGTLADLHAMMGRQLQCEAEFAEVRARRIAFARDELGLCADPAFRATSGVCDGLDLSSPCNASCRAATTAFCDDNAAKHTTEQPFAISVAQGFAATVTFQNLCDVRQRRFVMTFRTDGAFAPCGTTAQPGADAVIGDLVKRISKVRPREIRLVGHADVRKPGVSCKQQMGPDINNHKLAEQRAVDVKRIVEATLATLGDEWRPAVVPDSLGDREPLRTDCKESDERCHGENRRVTFGLVGGLEELDVNKCRLRGTAPER